MQKNSKASEEPWHALFSWCITVAVQVSCNAVEITWQHPESMGHPPFHKYKLQRAADLEGVSSDWTTVNRLLDVESTSWVDRHLQVLG